jgi:hypothetical protein
MVGSRMAAKAVMMILRTAILVMRGTTAVLAVMMAAQGQRWHTGEGERRRLFSSSSIFSSLTVHCLFAAYWVPFPCEVYGGEMIVQ